MLRTTLTAQAIDDVLTGTFPASDPPAWTPGMARLAPAIATPPADSDTPQDETNDVRADEIDALRPTRSERTFAQALVSLTAAAGLALLAPFAILAIGIPVVLGVRGLLEVADWFLAMVR